DLEPGEPVCLVTQSGQHHHRDRPALAQSPADLEAVDAGQHQVEDHEVRLPLGDAPQRLLTIVHALDGMSVADQVASDHVGDRRVVVDHDDPARQITIAHRYTVDRTVMSQMGKPAKTSETGKMSSCTGSSRSPPHRAPSGAAGPRV